jgi:hypothetical protein
VGLGFVVDILSLAISPPSPVVTELIFRVQFNATVVSGKSLQIWIIPRPPILS